MSRGLLLLLQVAVAVVAILLWHLFTTTSLVGDPSRMQFFFSTPGAVARAPYEFFRSLICRTEREARPPKRLTLPAG